MLPTMTKEDERRCKPLLDKREGFVHEMQDILDTALGERRALTKEEGERHHELKEEIRRMEGLIKKAVELGPSSGGSGGDVGAPGVVQFGERGDFRPSGYTTEHRDLAEFVRDVRFPTDRRVMSMNVGATGGFMVPDQLLQQVLQASPEDAVIAARATTIAPFAAAPDAATTIPALDQSGTKGVFGGVTMSWIAEGAAKGETEPALREIRLEPQEIAGYVTVTDKLIRNGGSEFSTFLNRTLGQALAAAQERAFLTGSGVGQPLGILNSPCRIQVARAGAGAIAYADFVDMIAVFGPNTWARGFWMASQSTLPQLLTMVDSGNHLIVKPADARLGTPPSILGLPLIVSSRTPPLGSSGDLMLLDASYYLRKLGSGPFVLASDGPKFTENKTIIKIFANVDGQAWLNGPLLQEDGVSTVSPFVVLAA